MQNVTFCIPLLVDSPDRLENITLVKKYLSQLTNNILIGEYDKTQKYPDSIFYHNPTDYFHKTWVLNQLYKKATTDIVVMYDSDVFIPIPQLQAAYKKIQTADLVYPYDGRFYNFDRRYKNLLVEGKFEQLELGKELHKQYDNAGTLISTISYGGCVFHKKSALQEIGWENENFRSWGSEDTAKYYMAKNYGMKIDRTNGVIYHLHHERTINSSDSNPFNYANQIECDKIVNMNREQIQNYIKEWSWK